jgi:hypothetical protein
MTQFVDMMAVAVSAPLKAAHYPFRRGKDLEDALKMRMTDYYAKAVSGTSFEASGLLVTGKSRVGKSRELNRLISRFNASDTLMPDGRPGRIISCSLWGRTTWRELGNTTLEALGYPAEGRRDQTYIWREVLRQAKREGVVGIHYDECQHMFTDTGEAANRVVLDSFKALLKERTWPMVLILSGVPELAKHIEKDRPTEDRRQLRFLLTPIHFEMINPSEDIPELNALAYSYAEKAGICFDDLSNMDFFQRLIHGCAYRWGLVIEMMIEAFTICVLTGDANVSINHFVEAFSRIYGLTPGFSPFLMPDYRESFDPDRLMDMLDRDL